LNQLCALLSVLLSINNDSTPGLLLLFYLSQFFLIFYGISDKTSCICFDQH
jgi:hypothetical protein